MSQYTVARSNGPWCFIDTHSSVGMLLALFCYYLWLIVCWLIIILVYIAIGKLLIRDYKKACNLNNDAINGHNNIITKVPTIQRLQYYPLIFIFCWSFEIISIAYNLFDEDSLFIIKCLQAVFTNLYGAFNAILFFFVIHHYTSNHVTHKIPKRIKKKTRTQTPQSERESVDGIQVTATTNNYQTKTSHDEVSGTIITLNPIGCVEVVSPSSIWTPEHMLGAGNGYAFSLCGQHDEVLVTDDDCERSGKGKNVMLGYNEDEEDESELTDFYSDDDGVNVIDETDEEEHDGNDLMSGWKEEILNNIKQTTESLCHPTSGITGFSLLRNETDVKNDVLHKNSHSNSSRA